jgi:tRNA G18 (ribose-2'-O)-methylase SpoU
VEKVARVREISSHQNPTFRKLKRLLKTQGVDKYRQALIAGRKHIIEVFRDFPRLCTGIVASQKGSIPAEILTKDLPVYRLDPKLFREIDEVGTNHPMLLVHATPLGEWTDDRWPPGCTLFVPFQDPTNVGAVIRSAVAFGVPRAVMLAESAHPFHTKSVRVAGSSLFRIELLKGPSIRQLGKGMFPLITLSPKGRDIKGFRFPPTFGLVPGVEGPGLPTEIKATTSLAVPMEAGVESLNAAMATGIALFLWRAGQRRSKVGGRRLEVRSKPRPES